MNKTIRLIIADDEVLVRERFKYGFPLKEHGFEIIGEAEDGEEALSLCEQLHPDIVITDIVMPRMDGLELTRKLKEKMPKTKIIILSNYQEFEFARKAVTYGAIGYMLKVTSGYRELLELLEQAREEILADHDRIVRDIRNRYQIQQSKPLLCKKFIIDMTNQIFYSNEDIKKQCNLLEIHPPSVGFTIAHIYIDRYEKVKNMFIPQNMSDLIYGLMKMIEELSEKQYKVTIFLWTENSIGLMINWDFLSQLQNAENNLLPLLKEIIKNINHYFPFTVSIPFSKSKRVSDAQHLANSLKEALEEAAEVLHKRFYTGYGQIHSYTQDYPDFWDLNDNAKEMLENQLKSLNTSLDGNALLEAIDQSVIVKIKEMNYDPRQIIIWIQQLTLDWTKNDPAAHKQFEGYLNSVETIDELAQYISKLLLWKRETQILINSENDYRQEIQKALQYIGCHYHEPLNVTDVCAYVNISPNYFSHLFHSQTGFKFTAYVKQYRIQQAQKLLLETSLQVQEIAEKVGIPDYRYFVRLFRQTTGQTPSNYRNNHQ